MQQSDDRVWWMRRVSTSVVVRSKVEICVLEIDTELLICLVWCWSRLSEVVAAFPHRLYQFFVNFF